MASSSAAAATVSAEPLEVPPLPPKLRGKPQRRGNIGAGKLYANEAAFLADVEAWKLEHAERVALVKERERMQERLRERNRDRSGRQRDGEHETDGERRVRQRHESAVQSAAHVDNERDRQAQKRRAERLPLQQAWATDIAVFAGIFASDEPRRHPLAYYGHRRQDWLTDGQQITALHNFIIAHPPTGELDWEREVDNRAFELWRDPVAKPWLRGCEDLWLSQTHSGDGYHMLLALPSAPKTLLESERHERHLRRRFSVNGDRAKEGLGPLPGWEASVAAGYMSPPRHQDLPANEMELIDRGIDPRAAELTVKFRSMQRFCAAVNGWGTPECHRWHHWNVPCDQAHRFPFHQNVLSYVPFMGGQVYVERHDDPVMGGVPATDFIQLIQQRNEDGTKSQPDMIWLDCESGRLRGGDACAWLKLNT